MRFRHLVMLGVSALVGAGFCGTALADPLPDGIYLSIGFSKDIGMDVLPPVDPDRTESPNASLYLANLGNVTATWNMDSDCAANSWTVTDPTGVVVDRSDACPPGGTPVTKTLAGGAQDEAEKLVVLHVFKYNEGTEYTLNYTYWGAAGTAKFTIHHEQ